MNEARQPFDLIIVGGGISGACLLWDSTLRGMNVLLLEKNDFASGTTQATSKLIHGGLRYLKNFEFGLVRESLRERRILARLAPHSIRPMPFLHPIYKNSKPGRFVFAIGLWLYDLLSFDRNRGVPRHLRLPRHRWLSRQEALQTEPSLHADGLQGAYVYYDYQNVNPERLCCDIIFSAVERGAQAQNYTQVKEISRDPLSGIHTVSGLNSDGAMVNFRSRSVINAAGPWADMIGRADSSFAKKRIVRSMGIHLITQNLVGEQTVVLHRKDGSHFFIVPWRNYSLIGTTDSVYEGHPDQFKIPESEIQGLLDDVAHGLNIKLKRSDVLSVYGGLRPLVEESRAVKNHDSYSKSRKTEIETDPGRPGYFSVLGGKYTTSRHLAEQTIDRVAEFLGGTFKPCVTANTPLRTGDFESQTILKQKLFLEKQYSRRRIETMISRYGLLAERMLSPEDKVVATLDNGEEYFGTEIATILKTEMVRNPSDLLLRRTGLGTAGQSFEKILETNRKARIRLALRAAIATRKQYSRAVRIAG
ncbi:MAG: glycerol-3-phosphate dehydrogenase/oxidase [Leptospirales bacterium]|nr:glycerol-3-phosphate dehydrogenase/oxidase [Leptospirales bacterium]